MISPDSIVRNARPLVGAFLLLAFIIPSLNLGSLYREWSGTEISTKAFGFTKTEAQMLFEEKGKETKNSEDKDHGHSVLALIAKAFAIRPLFELQVFHTTQSGAVSCPLVHVPIYIFERTLRI